MLCWYTPGNTKRPASEKRAQEGKMKQYGVNELRRMFLEFFESKGHLVMKSFSLVPHNDKSLLLINSGMAPLKPYFTGAEIPPRKRVTTCQKCIRPSIWMMTRPLIFGIRTLGFLRNVSSVSARRTTSGSMEPAPAVPVQRFTMTEERSMAAESRAVR